MRRWNGWGEEATTYRLPPGAANFLARLIGRGVRRRDASFREVLASVPPSRLPPHPLVTREGPDRVRHARGQSMLDWIALRSGRIPLFPDGVAYPRSDEEVHELLRYAQETEVGLIPYGGGTSVLGHINPHPNLGPVLTIDLGRLTGLKALDEKSRLAVFGAGTRGPDLEAELRKTGFTLGHFPQSFEFSTLGGWVATRSSGQLSFGYGRIERLFAGGKLICPVGGLVMPSFPASAAGPDLREMVLGSEGRLGVLTEVSVRVSRLPAREDFHAVFFPDWGRGCNAVREIAQSGLPLSMLRLSTTAETDTTLAMAGHRLMISSMERYLALRGVRDEKTMLLVGLAGADPLFKAVRKEVLAVAKRHSGVHVGRILGNAWLKNRFRAPYLRNTLWEAGYGVDTIESATSWGRISETVSAVETALGAPLGRFGEGVHVFSHLSHVYSSGSSLYTTFIFRLAPDPDETVRRWRMLKGAASEAILQSGGTISHHHGIGEDHLPYFEREKGLLGAEAIRRLCRTFDPKGIMNPGKLVVDLNGAFPQNRAL